MASLREEYSYRTTVATVGREVCYINEENLTEAWKAYEQKLVDVMLDELIRNPRAFSA